MTKRHSTAPQVEDPVESRSKRNYDTREIVEAPVNVPRYTTCNTFIVATGKRGSAPGELYRPCGVAFHEETHQIFVANSNNHRIEIFSETGEFFSQLGVGQLSIHTV